MIRDSDRRLRRPYMPIIPHWFPPTNGDSRSDLSLGNAVPDGSSHQEEADRVGERVLGVLRRRGLLAPSIVEPETLEL